MRARGYLWCVLALAAFTLLRAENATAAEEKENAQLLFDEGLRYMLDGDLKMGCAFIKQSLDVDPRPGTLFTLAECYSRAGKLASAVEHYDEYLNRYSRMSPEEKQKQQNRADVSTQERSRLVKQIPWITIALPDGAPDGVVATMDDEPFAPNLLGVAIAIDPGTHRFTARAPGGPLTETVIEVEAGTRRTHELRLVLEAPEDPVVSTDEVPEATDTEAGDGLSPWVFVFGGIGAAGIITGSITGAMLLSERQTILDHCQEPLEDGSVSCGAANDPEAREALETARNAQDTLAPITTVALGVGLGGLAVAAILLLTDDSTPSTTGRGISARASLAPDRTEIALTGRF